jgi:hypothetical protein
MRTSTRPVLASVAARRSAVILAVACIIGAAAGALTYLTSRSVPQALLATGAAVSGTAQLLRQITNTPPEQSNGGRGSSRDNARS